MKQQGYAPAVPKTAHSHWQASTSAMLDQTRNHRGASRVRGKVFRNTGSENTYTKRGSQPKPKMIICIQCNHRATPDSDFQEVENGILCESCVDGVLSPRIQPLEDSIGRSNSGGKATRRSAPSSLRVARTRAMETAPKFSPYLKS